MDHVAMRFWIKRRDKLIHDYSLTGYLLLPNPTIMAHTYENRSMIHNEAVVRLIDKLIVNLIFVGEEKSKHLSKYIDTFWDEFDYFVNRRGCFLINICETQHGVMTSRHTDGIRDILCKVQRYWESCMSLVLSKILAYAAIQTQTG